MAKRDILKKLIAKNYVHKRQGVKRDIRLNTRGENAKEAIGDLYSGCEIYGFTKGQFSIIDILEHCLLQTGQADVVVCTWSAASGDIKAAHRMLKTARMIKSLKFIVDFSFQSRKPAFCQELINTFGYDSIRVSSIHAKFMTIRSENYNLVIRTSMNLNHNPRFENFEISDDSNLLNFMLEIVDDIWKTQQSAEGFQIGPGRNQTQFKGMYSQIGLQQCDPESLEPGFV